MNNTTGDYKKFKLSKSVTVNEIEEWLEKFDEESRNKIISFIKSRFNERYILGVSVLKNHGFLKMSVACFMIETLQCFKMGEQNSKYRSRLIFKTFFDEEENFAEFKEISDDFYDNVRCGILHQSETTNAWRILCKGKLLDTNFSAFVGLPCSPAVAGVITCNGSAGTMSNLIKADHNARLLMIINRIVASLTNPTLALTM